MVNPHLLNDMNKGAMNAWSLLMDFSLAPSFYLRTRALPYSVLDPTSLSLGAANVSHIPKDWFILCFNLDRQSKNCPY